MQIAACLSQAMEEKNHHLRLAMALRQQQQQEQQAAEAVAAAAGGRINGDAPPPTTHDGTPTTAAGGGGGSGGGEEQTATGVRRLRWNGVMGEGRFRSTEFTACVTPTSHLRGVLWLDTRLYFHPADAACLTHGAYLLPQTLNEPSFAGMNGSSLPMILTNASGYH